MTALDPAGSYDLGSSTMEYNLYQTLVTVPPNSTKIVGDAAKSCTYNDPKTLTCTLNPGEKFSNGDPLTSEDVKYSFDRAIKIQDANGAAIYLLGSITDTAKDGTVTMNKGAIETPDPQTVVFHLDHPDTTFQYVLTYPGAAAIVDHKVFPADKKLARRPDHRLRALQAGPVQGRRAGRARAQLQLHGPQPGQGAPGVRQVLHGAVGAEARRPERGGRRRLAEPGPDRRRLAQEGQQRHGGHGQGRRDPLLGLVPQECRRQAAGHTPSRGPDLRPDAIASNAYDNTVDPLYSIVPPGYGGQKDSFKTAYGSPDVAKAKAILQKAGIKTPINITVGWTPTHYGPSTEDEANEVQRQLEASGLFKVTLKSTEWDQYQTIYKQGAYDLYILGWFPDYPDADDYLSPFLVNGGFFQNGYSNPQADKLVAEEQGTSDQAKRQQIFGQLQDIAAKDVPFIPSWVGQNTAVYGKGMSGVESTLDPSFIFRFWLVTKNG